MSIVGAAELQLSYPSIAGLWPPPPYHQMAIEIGLPALISLITVASGADVLVYELRLPVIGSERFGHQPWLHAELLPFVQQVVWPKALLTRVH